MQDRGALTAGVGLDATQRFSSLSGLDDMRPDAADMPLEGRDDAATLVRTDDASAPDADDLEIGRVERDTTGRPGMSGDTSPTRNAAVAAAAAATTLSALTPLEPGTVPIVFSLPDDTRMQVSVPLDATVSDVAERVAEDMGFEDGVELSFGNSILPEDSLMATTNVLDVYSHAGSLLKVIEDGNLTPDQRAEALDSTCAIVESLSNGVRDMELLCDAALAPHAAGARSGAAPQSSAPGSDDDRVSIGSGEFDMFNTLLSQQSRCGPHDPQSQYAPNPAAIRGEHPVVVDRGIVLADGDGAPTPSVLVQKLSKAMPNHFTQTATRSLVECLDGVDDASSDQGVDSAQRNVTDPRSKSGAAAGDMDTVDGPKKNSPVLQPSLSAIRDARRKARENAALSDRELGAKPLQRASVPAPNIGESTFDVGDPDPDQSTTSDPPLQKLTLGGNASSGIFARGRRQSTSGLPLVPNPPDGATGPDAAIHAAAKTKSTVLAGSGGSATWLEDVMTTWEVDAVRESGVLETTERGAELSEYLKGLDQEAEADIERERISRNELTPSSNGQIPSGAQHRMARDVASTSTETAPSFPSAAGGEPALSITTGPTAGNFDGHGTVRTSEFLTRLGPAASAVGSNTGAPQGGAVSSLGRSVVASHAMPTQGMATGRDSQPSTLGQDRTHPASMQQPADVQKRVATRIAPAPSTSTLGGQERAPQRTTGLQQVLRDMSLGTTGTETPSVISGASGASDPASKAGFSQATQPKAPALGQVEMATALGASGLQDQLIARAGTQGAQSLGIIGMGFNMDPAAMQPPVAPAKPAPKKRGRKRKNPELTDEERALVRKLQNRESAKLSRVRRKVIAAEYEDQISELIQNNERLKSQVTALTNKLSYLQSLLTVSVTPSGDDRASVVDGVETVGTRVGAQSQPDQGNRGEPVDGASRAQMTFLDNAQAARVDASAPRQVLDHRRGSAAAGPSATLSQGTRPQQGVVSTGYGTPSQRIGAPV